MKSTAGHHGFTGVDAVFTNGWVYTGDERVPRWGGLAVADGKILSVNTEDVTALERSAATVIDLGGRLLLPGFQDAHVHPVAAGVEMLGCDLSACRTAEEALTTIGEYARTHPELDWITGGGWSMDAFAGGTPTRTLLDRVVADRPVLLENRDHHSAWANSCAFALAGIEASTSDPADGRIEREADGSPAGTVHDGAIFLFDGVRPAIDEERAYTGLLAAQQHLLSFGITGWQDAAVGSLMGQPDTLPIYLRALEEGTLRARVRGAQWWDRTSGISQLTRMRERYAEVAARYSSERFSLGSVKIMVDGVAESRTAAMHGHYRDAQGLNTQSTGMTFFGPDELIEYVTAIDAAGLQIHFHTLGDRAVTNALDALEAARRSNGPSTLRHHLAHLEVVRSNDAGRFAELGAVANLQSFWAAHDPQLDELVLPFLPVHTEGGVYPFATLAAAGARLALGSDWPVSTPDPLQAIYVGINRRHAGSSEPPLHPEQSLGLSQLITAATSGSAYVNHLDTFCGRLRPGMLADFAILNANLFELAPEELSTAHNTETWIGGEQVYERSTSPQ